MDGVKMILEEVNGMVETTLLLTRADVGKTMSLLKKINDVEEFQEVVSDIVRNLQCFDIFEQRLRHAMEINYFVPIPDKHVEEKLTDSALTVFRVNQVQCDVAWSDYFQAISFIKFILDPHTNQLPFQLDFASTGFLTRAAMDLTSNKFDKIVSLTYKWLPAQLPLYLNAIQQVYSTDVERKVLGIVCANPNVTMQEIKASLAASYNKNDSCIDLF
jgi:hypothetical protein